MNGWTDVQYLFHRHSMVNQNLIMLWYKFGLPDLPGLGVTWHAVITWNWDAFTNAVSNFTPNMKQQSQWHSICSLRWEFPMSAKCEKQILCSNYWILGSLYLIQFLYCQWRCHNVVKYYFLSHLYAFVSSSLEKLWFLWDICIFVAHLPTFFNHRIFAFWGKTVILLNPIIMLIGTDRHSMLLNG